MKQVRVVNLERPATRPLVASYCADFACKLRGLAFRPSLPADGALILDQGSDSRLNSAIHMFGMLFDLSIVWVNEAMEVVDVRLAYAWKSIFIPRRSARYVIECSADRHEDFHIGDKLSFQDAAGA